MIAIRKPLQILHIIFQKSYPGQRSASSLYHHYREHLFREYRNYTNDPEVLKKFAKEEKRLNNKSHAVDE